MSVATQPRPKSKVRFNEDGDPILPPGAEYVDGKILEKAVSELSNWVSFQLAKAIDNFVLANNLGVTFTGAGEQGFQCFPDKPKQIRKPDVSFVRRVVSKDFLSTKGFTTDVPELVAEVVSPQDRVQELEDKIQDYRAAGTRLIWVIHPMNRTAKIIHRDGVEVPIGEDGVLSGEDVLPGFSLPLSAILPPKTQA